MTSRATGATELTRQSGTADQPALPGAVIRSERAFISVSALLFAASAAVTIIWCGSMSTMGGMEMPGDWTMSMAWMRMPGQSWLSAAVSFVGMWSVMMVAMMLPSVVPMLVRYRQALGRVGDARKGWLTALAGMAYFSVWGGVGVIAFPLGVALAAITMESATLARIVPMAIGLVVVIAGVLQFSAWKARQLVCCRGGAGGLGALGDDVSTALSYGLRLGFHCTSCCAGLTVILLVIGVMDLRAMAIVTAAITLERLAPGGRRVARIIGAVIVGAGVVLMGQAA